MISSFSISRCRAFTVDYGQGNSEENKQGGRWWKAGFRCFNQGNRVSHDYPSWEYMFEISTPFEKEVWSGLFERSSCQLYPMVLIASIILLHLWNKVKIEDRKLSQLPSEPILGLSLGGDPHSTQKFHQATKNDGPWLGSQIHNSPAWKKHGAFFELVSNQHFRGAVALGLRICQRNGR